MPNPEVLALAGGVSSVFGVIGLLAAFYYYLQTRRIRHSFADLIIGEGGVEAEKVLSILNEFRDEQMRLTALTELLKWDRGRTTSLLKKIQDNVAVDLEKLTRISHGHYFAKALTAALFFSVLAFVAYLFAHSTSTYDDESAAAHASVLISGVVREEGHTNAPIEGAIVSIQGLDPNSSGVSYGDGTFSFNARFPGKQLATALHVHHKQYFDYETATVLQAGQDIKDLALKLRKKP